jgi:hypothetical protein
MNKHMYKIYNGNGGFWGEVETKGEAIDVCSKKGGGYTYKCDKIEEDNVTVLVKKKVEVRGRKSTK